MHTYTVPKSTSESQAHQNYVLTAPEPARAPRRLRIYKWRSRPLHLTHNTLQYYYFLL